jgi:KDO2-lipid IV(A) lauroyltransferase
MNLKSTAIDTSYWLGWHLFWRLPTRFSFWFFDKSAILVWKREIMGVRQLELNLARVHGYQEFDPRIRELSLLAMQSYMRYYCETFLLLRWSEEKILRTVRPENVEPLHTALKSGGAVLALPHLANWDLAGAWAALYFGSVCSVAERLRPEGVFQKFLAMRAALGVKLMPLTGEGGTYEFLRDHVNQGELVALLGDRDVAKSGMSNEFFGHRAALPIGPALLALDTGRPLFTCAPWYDGETMVITFDNEIEFDRTPVQGRERLRRAQEVTAQVLSNFETHIAAHSSNWHQLQPIWPDLVANSEKSK